MLLWKLNKEVNRLREAIETCQENAKVKGDQAEKLSQLLKDAEVDITGLARENSQISSAMTVTYGLIGKRDETYSQLNAIIL